MKQVMNKKVAISGSLGIEQDAGNRVTFGHYQRNNMQQRVVGHALQDQPVDTATANEKTFCQPADQKLVEDLFNKWNQALQTYDAGKVAELYADDAVLLPTVSNVPRTSKAEIKDYFEHFLEKKPFGIIKQRNIKKGCNKITDAGIYDFEVEADGRKSVVPARYTFVYEYRNNEWKIVHHHSSMMPEK